MGEKPSCICKLKELKGVQRIYACNLLVANAILDTREKSESFQRTNTLRALMRVKTALDLWKDSLP